MSRDPVGEGVGLTCRELTNVETVGSAQGAPAAEAVGAIAAGDGVAWVEEPGDYAALLNSPLGRVDPLGLTTADNPDPKCPRLCAVEFPDWPNCGQYRFSSTASAVRFMREHGGWNPQVKRPSPDVAKDLCPQGGTHYTYRHIRRRKDRGSPPSLKHLCALVCCRCCRDTAAGPDITGKGCFIPAKYMYRFR